MPTPQMTIHQRNSAAFLIGCLLLLVLPVTGWSQEKTEQKPEQESGRTLLPSSAAGMKHDDRPAQVLYEEANGYLAGKYAEFNKQHLGYDSKLEAKTKQEQKDLALRNAATLAARKRLTDDDLYYLGMLRHLSGNSDATLEVMRGFLATARTGEKQQLARAVFVLHAVRKNLIAEAETEVASYRVAEPVDHNELYGMEALLTNAFNKAKDYERMATHARGMLEVAKRETPPATISSFKRDERLFKGASLLAEALVKMNQQEAAVAVINDLLKLSIALPSGNLYKLARVRLAGLNSSVDPQKWLGDTANMQVKAPPEIAAAEWIDREPTKLSELRGQVVLLDFWAHWCGPCQYVFPKLQRWHESYKDKGLVILGITNYFGQTNGRRATTAEELAYLRDFKKRYRLPYGFAVADSSVNDFNYGVSSIPMSFLIDRGGNVRFIAVGANDEETTALGKMIKELIAEPVPPAKPLAAEKSQQIER